MNDFLAQLVFVFVSNLIIGGSFLYVGAIVAGIKDGTFEKAFWVNLQGSILSFLAIWIIFFIIPIPILNILIGWIAGFFIYVNVVSKKYKTTFGKAFVASLIYTIIGFLFFILVLFVLASQLKQQFPI